MTRRVLNRIRLDKIAAVDLPCQEPATFAIIKRAPGNAPPAIAKKTFQEALNAQLVSERISDTFWRAFENQWAVREAFRVALSDEIAEGGDGDDAVAGFTEAMQQIATLASEAAREAANPTENNTLEQAVEQAISKWLETKETDMTKYTTKALLKAGIAKFNPETSSVADMNAIKKAAVDLDAEDELPVEGPLAKAKSDNTDATEVTALKREVAVLKLAPNIRKHFDGLAADAQTAFLAKSDADQVAEVEAIEKGDPILYTTKGGIDIRKSDGATVLALAKQNDEQAATIASLSAGSTDATIAKRAAKDFPNVAEAEAVDMLKAADKLGEDSDASKSILKTLTTMNKARGSLFKSLGSTETPELDGDTETALTEFNKAVDDISARDKIGKSAAMSKVRSEQPELFKRAYPESVEESEDA